MTIAAVIFDLDGTVLDNEQQWEDAFRQVYKDKFKKEWKGDAWIHEPGISLESNWKKIAAAKDYQELSLLTWNTYWKSTHDSSNIKVMDGVVDLIRVVKQMGFATALATGSNWNVVEPALEKLNLYMAFDITTTGDEVYQPKPSPEIYFLTAQKLGISPEECLVIEDSYAGVESATAADCNVIALESDYTENDILKEKGATVVIKNLSEIVSFLEGLTKDTNIE